MQRFDTTIGSDYDIFNKVYPFTERLQKESVLFLKESLKWYWKRILEIWTWNWETTLQIINHFQNSIIDTVDISEVMQKSAIEVLKYQKTSNKINFILEDILQYIKKIPDGFYDWAVSCFTIHNIFQTERPALYKELWRIIKKWWIFVNWDKVIEDDVEKHKDDLQKCLDLYKKFTKDFNRPDLEKEWIEHYLRDDKDDLKLTKWIQEKMLLDSWFGELQYSGRMLTEIITSAKKL